MLLLIGGFYNLSAQDISNLDFTESQEKMYLYLKEKNYAKALHYAKKAAGEIKEERGEDNMFYASTFYLAGACHKQLGQYKESETAYLKAKTLFQKLPDYGVLYLYTLNNLAGVYLNTNELEKAKTLYEEVLKSAPKEDEIYHKTINNLTVLH